MHICIIGAGVIGVTSAWALARAGHDVTVLEAREAAGLATSYANGGQLSYSYVAPLAEPGVFRSLPGWLLKHDSPLRFRPRLDPQQWRWGAAFLRHCTAATVRRTTAQMLTLSYLSRDALDTLLAEHPIPFDYRVAGKFIAYRDPALLTKARARVALQAEHGARQQVLDANACVALEPAFAAWGEQLAGAVYTEDEAVADCHAFTQHLAASLCAAGKVTLRCNARVARLERSNDRITAIHLQDGSTVRADHVVLANALASRPLLRALGSDAPLYALKGYSLSLPLAAAGRHAPAISVTDYQRRIVYARIGNVLRIAAMVDMGAADDVSAPQPDPARIALLKQQVRDTFPDMAVDEASVWAGLRPATPDSKPRIGRSPAAENLWLNLGHGALGFTLACGSAMLLATQMAGNAAPVDPRPFLPD